MILRYWLRCLCLLVGLAVMAGVAWAVTADQIATSLRNSIACRWRSTDLKVQVTPYAGCAGLDQGRIKRISVTATSVTMEGIKMTGVKLSADDLVMDVPKLVHSRLVIITRRRADTIQCRVGEADLNKALALKPNGIQNLHVTLGDGVLTFTGTYKLALGANFMLQGRMETPDNYKINFVPTKASVNGVPLPTGPLKMILSKVNPLIDFHKVPMQPKIDRIIVESGYLAVVG